MKRFLIMLLFFTVVTAMSGCDKEEEESREKENIFLYMAANRVFEVFNEADRPVYERDVAGDFYYCKPWNYDKPHNAFRIYPLFIYLHGSGGQGLPSSLPCFYRDQNQKKYPSFVFIPHAINSTGGWNNTTLIQQIENLRAMYRIDPNRIYVMGYSMGGWGASALVNAYYDYNRQIFAGIVRMAGFNTYRPPRNAILDKTSIWDHVGLSDSADTVEGAQDSYEYFKSYAGYAGASESSGPVPAIVGYPGTTLTLRKNNIEIVKYTRYDPPVGHGVSHFPLKDPYLLEWLYRQTLDNR